MKMSIFKSPYYYHRSKLFISRTDNIGDEFVESGGGIAREKKSKLHVACGHFSSLLNVCFDCYSPSSSHIISLNGLALKVIV